MKSNYIYINENKRLFPTCFVNEYMNVDSTGCDLLFLAYFILPNMLDTIAKVLHTFFKKRPQYLLSNYTIYVYEMPAFAPPEMFILFKFLNRMFFAAKSGDVYAQNVFVWIYKFFYKKEYLQLKRFKELGSNDIISFSSVENGCDIRIAARILCMSDFLGIPKTKDCLIFYEDMLTKKDQTDVHLTNTCEQYHKISTKEYDDCQLEYKKLKQEEPTNQVISNLYEVALKMIEHSLQFQGFPVKYISANPVKCSLGTPDPVTTLYILKKHYPKKKFSFQEVRFLSVIYYVVEHMTESFYDISNILDGILEDTEFPQFPVGLRKEQSNDVSIYSKTQASKDIPEIASLPNSTSFDYSEIQLLNEKLQEEKEKYQQLQILYTEKVNMQKDFDHLTQKYLDEHTELIKLRSQLYHAVDELSVDTSPEDISLMTSAIANKNIIIIGGKPNWISKLRNIFPNWKYVSPCDKTTLDIRLLKNADNVYFYTDYMSHALYYKYINILREKKLQFGYINTLNINMIVEQIYNDVIISNAS